VVPLILHVTHLKCSLIDKIYFSRLSKQLDFFGQNIASALVPMFTTTVGSKLTWKFLRDDWNKLIAITPVSGETMRKLVTVADGIVLSCGRNTTVTNV